VGSEADSWPLVQARAGSVSQRQRRARKRSAWSRGNVYVLAIGPATATPRDAGRQDEQSRPRAVGADNPDPGGCTTCSTRATTWSYAAPGRAGVTTLSTTAGGRGEQVGAVGAQPQPVDGLRHGRCGSARPAPFPDRRSRRVDVTAARIAARPRARRDVGLRPADAGQQPQRHSRARLCAAAPRDVPAAAGVPACPTRVVAGPDVRGHGRTAAGRGRPGRRSRGHGARLARAHRGSVPGSAGTGRSQLRRGASACPPSRSGPAPPRPTG